MKTIEAQWDVFAGLTVPVDATDVQRREMRRSFFSGNLAALSTVLGVEPTARQAITRALFNEAEAELRRINREYFVLESRQKKGPDQ